MSHWFLVRSYTNKNHLKKRPKQHMKFSKLRNYMIFNHLRRFLNKQMQ